MHERINEDGPKCHECGQYTERVGSFSLCPVLRCDMWAIPVNDNGERLTPTDQADGSSDLRLVPLPEDEG